MQALNNNIIVYKEEQPPTTIGSILVQANAKPVYYARVVNATPTDELGSSLIGYLVAIDWGKAHFLTADTAVIKATEVLAIVGNPVE